MMLSKLKQNAELKKTNHELAKGVKLLRQNASAGGKECHEYRDLLMESQAENERL
jgi:cell division protein FtsB